MTSLTAGSTSAASTLAGRAAPIALQSLIATTNTTVQRQLCVRRRQFQRRADGRLFLDPRPRRPRPRSTRRFRAPSASCRPTRQPRPSPLPTCRASSAGPFAALFSGSNWTSQLVVGLQHRRRRRDRAGPDRSPPRPTPTSRVSAARRGLRDADRIRRLVAQHRGAAGGRSPPLRCINQGAISMTTTEAASARRRPASPTPTTSMARS